jgi:hypothetical protein
MHPLPIGKTDDPFNTGNIFSIPADARRKHTAIFGKSGVGKSTLLRNMIAWDIDHGAGVAVQDPHGSLVDEILETIPRHRTNDVIYFNPKDHTRAMGLNIFDQGDAQERALLVSYLISIFKALWGDSWGPRMEDILRNAAFALSEQPQPVSLLALPRLLNDPSYRRAVLRHVKNPVVKAFFHTYEHGWTKQFREEAIAPVLNKVNAFITNPLLRAVIGQATSAFRFRWVMDTGKILLCDLSKGALGEDASSLLGSLITTKLYLAALRASRSPNRSGGPSSSTPTRYRTSSTACSSPPSSRRPASTVSPSRSQPRSLRNYPRTQLTPFSAIAPRSSASASAATTLRRSNANSRPSYQR